MNSTLTFKRYYLPLWMPKVVRRTRSRLSPPHISHALTSLKHRPQFLPNKPVPVVDPGHFHIRDAAVYSFQARMFQHWVVFSDKNAGRKCRFQQQFFDVPAAQVKGIHRQPAAEGAPEAFGFGQVIGQEMMHQGRHHANFPARLYHADKPVGFLQNTVQQPAHPHGRVRGGGHALGFDAVGRYEVEVVELRSQVGQHGLGQARAETEGHKTETSFALRFQNLADDSQQVFLGKSFFIPLRLPVKRQVERHHGVFGSQRRLQHGKHPRPVAEAVDGDQQLRPRPETIGVDAAGWNVQICRFHNKK